MKQALLIPLLLFVLVTNEATAQKSGSFQILFDYGVDRDISVVYHSLPYYGQDWTLSQVTSKHPRAFSVLYQWGKSNWKYRAGAGMLTRSLQKYKNNEGLSGQTNYTRFHGIAGIARTKRINDLISLSYGLDLIGSYQNTHASLEESHRIIDIDGQDPVIIRTKILFGANSDEPIAMFCPYIQTGIQLSKNTKLVLGFGVYGQFTRSYYFTMIVGAGIPGSLDNVYTGSRAFHMWVPFLRAGIELF